MATSEPTPVIMRRPHLSEIKGSSSLVASLLKFFLIVFISSLLSHKLQCLLGSGIRFFFTVLFRSPAIVVNGQDKDEFSSIILAVIGTIIISVALTGGSVLYYRMFHPPTHLNIALERARRDDVKDNVQMLKLYRDNLQSVRVTAMEDYQEDEISSLFEELVRLPNLVLLAVDLRLPANLLIRLIELSQSLRELSLSFQITGSNSDFTRLSKSFRTNSVLEKILIDWCGEEEESAGGFLKWDPVIEELGNLPTLRSLSVCHVPASPPCFVKLLQSPYLQTLALTHIPFLSRSLLFEHVVNARYFSVLQSLTAPLHPGTGMAWARLLEQTSTLVTFTLTIEEPLASRLVGETRDSVDSTMDPFLALAQALAVNSSLQSVTLAVNENLREYSLTNGAHNKITMSNQSLWEMSASLKHNRTLRELKIECCRPDLGNSSPVIGAFVDTLRYNNYAMERLELITTNCKILRVPEIEFFTKCNRLGRGELFQKTVGGHDAMIQFLGQRKVDLSTVCHVLTERPELLASHGGDK